MADTTVVNTGEKSGVNKGLEEYFESNIGHQICFLEFLFHTNEIYFTYAKNFLKGKAKGPNAYEDGALINKIKKYHTQTRRHENTARVLDFCHIYCF